MFTIWDTLPHDLINTLDGFLEMGKVVFWKFQMEQCPETGRVHLQGYVHWARSLKLVTIKRRLGEGHYEIRRGTAKEAAAYAGKEETRVDGPWEGGDINKCTQGARTDLHTFGKQYAENPQTAMESRVDLFVRYHSGLEKYRQATIRPREEKPVVILWTGSSGAGKTKTAIEYAKERGLEYYRHSISGKWFDGYRQQPVCIIDEMDKKCMDRKFDFDMVLNLLDRYECKVEVKGGVQEFTSTYILMTAIEFPDVWFKDKVDAEQQLKRRIDFWYHRNSMADPWEEQELWRPWAMPIKQEVYQAPKVIVDGGVIGDSDEEDVEAFSLVNDDVL